MITNVRLFFVATIVKYVKSLSTILGFCIVFLVLCIIVSYFIFLHPKLPKESVAEYHQVYELKHG